MQTKVLDFNEILPDVDFRKLMSKDLFDPVEDFITMGTTCGVSEHTVIRFTNIWVLLVDQWLVRAQKHNISEAIEQLWKFRGYTCSEFLDIWNQHIEPENFQYYPAYRYSGIASLAQRERFITKYQEHDEITFAKALKDTAFSEVLNFFFDRGSRLYHIPLSTHDEHILFNAPIKSGKSTAMRHLVYDLQQKYPNFTYILVDPHGSLAKQVYRSNLHKDHKRVIYFDIDFAKGHVPSINLFKLPNKEDKTIRFAAESIIGAINEVIQTKFSDKQMDILQMVVNFLLLKREDASMELFVDLLGLEPKILKQAQQHNPFFREEYLNGETNATRSALLSRVRFLLKNLGLGEILTGKPTINLEDYMDAGKTIIFNLGGLPGEVARPTFGKLLLSYLKNMCFKRDPEGGNIPLYIIIDEWQNFMTSTMEIFLSQMRKFDVRLVLANQYVEQLGEKNIIHSVSQNIGTKIVRGRRVSDVTKIISLPKKFIVRKDDEEGLDHKQFEWYVETISKKTTKIKAPSRLLSSKKFELSEEELAELDAYQLENYYRPIIREEAQESANQELEMFEDDDLPFVKV